MAVVEDCQVQQQRFNIFALETGMNFSMAEQKVALSMILRKYELSVPEDSIHKDELQFTTNILFNFAKEVKLNFKRRY